MSGAAAAGIGHGVRSGCRVPHRATSLDPHHGLGCGPTRTPVLHTQEPGPRRALPKRCLKPKAIKCGSHPDRRCLAKLLGFRAATSQGAVEGTRTWGCASLSPDRVRPSPCAPIPGAQPPGPRLHRSPQFRPRRVGLHQQHQHPQLRVSAERSARAGATGLSPPSPQRGPYTAEEL